MIRFLHALALGAALAPCSVILHAQQDCTSGSIDNGCGGAFEDPRSTTLVATMDSTSDLDLGLMYAVGGSAVTVSTTGVPPSDSVFLAFDPALGRYRAFDLGALNTSANTQANVNRITQYLASISTQSAADYTDNVRAMLSDVDSKKNEAVAYDLRHRGLLLQAC